MTRRPAPRRPPLLRLAGGALVVAGAAVLAPIAWQLWVAGPQAATAQQAAAQHQLSRWTAEPSGRPATEPAAAASAPPVTAEPRRTGAVVAVLRVPRFGAHWVRTVRQGVDEQAVLNSATAGVGHYPGTAMPGGVGNFAVAGHDTGWGDAFLGVSRLRVGDRILVTTAEGTWTYRFRNFQWVAPSEVRVLDAVPMRPGRIGTARLITLTTCDPPYAARERMIAYGVLTGFAAA